MGGKGGGPAWPPSCSQPTLSLPAPWPWAALLTQEPLEGPTAGAPTVPPGPTSRSSRAQSFAGPRHSTCSRLSREEAGSSWAAPPMGARHPPPRAPIRRRRGAGPRALEPAKRGDRKAPRVPRRPPAAGAGEGASGRAARAEAAPTSAVGHGGASGQVSPILKENHLPCLRRRHTSQNGTQAAGGEGPTLWNSCDRIKACRGDKTTSCSSGA